MKEVGKKKKRNDKSASTPTWCLNGQFPLQRCTRMFTFAFRAAAGVLSVISPPPPAPTAAPPPMETETEVKGAGVLVAAGLGRPPTTPPEAGEPPAVAAGVAPTNPPPTLLSCTVDVETAATASLLGAAMGVEKTDAGVPATNDDSILAGDTARSPPSPSEEKLMREVFKIRKTMIHTHSTQ